MKPLLLLALACVAHGAIGTPTCVKGEGSAAFSTTIATASITVNTGDTVVVWGGNQVANLSVADAGGVNVYTAEFEFATGVYRGRVFYTKNATAFTGVITMTVTNAQYQLIHACAVSGLNPTTPLDVTGSGHGQASSSGSPYTSNAFTTDTANEIIFSFSFGVGASSYVADSNFTIPTNGTSSAAGVVEGAVQYRIVSSIQTAQTLQWAWTGGIIDNEKAEVSFRMAGGSSGGCGIKGTASLKGTAGCR